MKPRSAAGEMKLAIVPRRSAPIRNCIVPTSTVTASASAMYSGEPTRASGASVATRASEFALVGPETTCQLEPNSAATMQGTTAVYRPYSGGSPASVANAIPCGRTSSAPSTPATTSARTLARSTRWIHDPKTRAASSFTARRLSDAGNERR